MSNMIKLMKIFCFIFFFLFSLSLCTLLTFEFFSSRFEFFLGEIYQRTTIGSVIRHENMILLFRNTLTSQDFKTGVLPIRWPCQHRLIFRLKRSLFLLLLRIQSRFGRYPSPTIIILLLGVREFCVLLRLPECDRRDRGLQWPRKDLTLGACFLLADWRR
jgi:hypothetical protein